MSTTHFDRIVTEGTGTVRSIVRLADGHLVTLITRPGSPFGIDEVYLWPGLEAPDTDGWGNEDHVELWLTSGDSGPDEGLLFREVPSYEVRALIQQHGGEHADQSDPTDA